MLLSLLVSSAVAHAFQFDELKALVETHDVRSVEETLPLLPKMNHVLMFKSRSLQAGSFENPRAILFNDDGTLFISLTAEPRGAGRLEIIDFNRAEARFAFKTVQFSAGARAVVNEAPTNCAGCHGHMKQDLRPLWDPGLEWRGAYGSHDDQITGSPDEPAYRAFLSKRDRLYASLALSEGPHDALENRPNLQLGLLLMRDQALRIARLLADESGEKLRRLAGCVPVGDVGDVARRVEANLARFLPPIYGQAFADSFVRDEAPALESAMAEGDFDLNEWALTMERSNAVFDGSFAFHDLLVSALARRAGLRGRSLVEAPLGLKRTPALEAVDSLLMPLTAESTKAVCEM